MFGNAFKTLIVIIALAYGVTACRSMSTAQFTEIAATSTDQVMASPAPPTGTSQPSPTPVPSRVILLAPDGADAGVIQPISESLSSLAVENGLEFETRSTLAQESMANVQLVVALPPIENLPEMVARSPDIPFLAVGFSGLQAGGNLNVITAAEEYVSRQAFIAGYLAAVVTRDWRVGVLSTADDSGQAARQAFLNGVVFFCGLCRPVYPPFYQYPVFAEINTGDSLEIQISTAGTLFENAADTVFLAPGIEAPPLMRSLVDAGIHLIGTKPVPAEFSDYWIASIQPDWEEIISTAWQKLSAGERGFALSVPVKISNANDDLFSPGRQNLVGKTLGDLNAGFIGTGVEP